MIRVLDKFVADKIAAGEVIERPVSVIKELVENSIDADAGSVIVEIRGGGKTYIRITDDGSGIPAEEAETAFLRHATSKLKDVTDLDCITTLGFRGEALASIAAVSKLTIVTRTADSRTGIKLVMHGGRVIFREAVGANIGTTIVVEDLFYNVPARRKFMKSEAREGTSVIELIQQYAVCRSDMRFMMVRNGETVFATSGNGDTLSAIRRIYPGKDYSNLIEVTGSSIRGYISDPGTTKPSRKGQLFFVNGRLVSSPVIEKGLEKGYGGRVFSGFPIAVLFIDQDPSELDVNIHPGKKEIRFLKSNEVTAEIASAVEDALRSRAAVPSMLSKNSPEGIGTAGLSSGTSDSYGEAGISVNYSTETNSADDHTADMVREQTSTRNRAADATFSLHFASTNSLASGSAEQASIRDYLNSISREAVSSGDDSREESNSGIYGSAAAPFSFDELRYAGYIFDSYIIMQDRDTMYIFDQHAAHERINYEKFMAAYDSSSQLPQPVITPIILSFSPDVYETGREMLEPLRRMGYDISDFGLGSFSVRGVPPYVTLSEAEGFLQAYFEASKGMSSSSDAVADKLIMRSCKASVKAGNRLSDHEITELMKELARCKEPYACPHGRPTFIRFTKYELERSFRRK